MSDYTDDWHGQEAREEAESRTRGEAVSTADDAWQEWLDPLSHSVASPGLIDCTHKAFLAGYRRALEDAADYAEAVDEDGDRPGLEATGVWDSAPDELTELLMRPDGLELLTRWLRDRAAGVGTKDGDDDE